MLIVMLLFFRALYVFGCLFEAEKYTKTTPQLGPKLFQNHPWTAPKSTPKWVQNGVLEPSWRPLGYGSFWGGLILTPSWPLGALLDASGPQKSNWGTAPGRPEATWETGFSYLGGQIPSQKEPRRVPNRGPKAVQAENGKTLKFDECLTKFVDF